MRARMKHRLTAIWSARCARMKHRLRAIWSARCARMKHRLTAIWCFSLRSKWCCSRWSQWCDVCLMCRKAHIIREANIIRRSRHHLPQANIIEWSIALRRYEAKNTTSWIFHEAFATQTWSKAHAIPSVHRRCASWGEANIICRRQTSLNDASPAAIWCFSLRSKWCCSRWSQWCDACPKCGEATHH